MEMPRATFPKGSAAPAQREFRIGEQKVESGTAGNGQRVRGI